MFHGGQAGLETQKWPSPEGPAVRTVSMLVKRAVLRAPCVSGHPGTRRAVEATV